MSTWIGVILFFLAVGAVWAFFDGTAQGGKAFLKQTFGLAIASLVVVGLGVLVLGACASFAGEDSNNYDPRDDRVCTNLGCD